MPNLAGSSGALRERAPCDRMIREPERAHITGLSRTSWWHLERKGRAPRRLRIDVRTIAWRLSDIEKWIEVVASGETWID